MKTKKKSGILYESENRNNLPSLKHSFNEAIFPRSFAEIEQLMRCITKTYFPFLSIW